MWWRCFGHVAVFIEMSDSDLVSEIVLDICIRLLAMISSARGVGLGLRLVVRDVFDFERGLYFSSYLNGLNIMLTSVMQLESFSPLCAIFLAGLMCDLTQARCVP